jgi:hypothetical protein
MWARAAWAAILLMATLVSVGRQGWVIGQPDTICRNIGVNGIDSSDELALSRPSQFIDESALVMFRRDPKDIVNASDHCNRRGFIASDLSGLCCIPVEVFSSRLFVAWKDSCSSGQVACRDIFYAVAICPSSFIIARTYMAREESTLNGHETGRCSSNILGSKFDPYVPACLIKMQWRISTCAIKENPRALIGFHGVQLAAHHTILFVRIETGDAYGSEADSRRDPKTNHFRVLPRPFAVFLGCILIGLALKLLSHTLYRGDYLTYFGLFGGFIPFALGFALILFCFLPDPPPVFGFSIGHGVPVP